METNLLNLAPSQLRRAAELKERIDALTTELGQILGDGSNGSSATGKVKTTGRRQMSAAGRARIAAAARARWAKARAAKGGSVGSTGSAGGKRRTMSAAARAKIAAAARARWAKVRAAKGKK